MVLAIIGAVCVVDEARAQGRMCERDDASELCWRCADVSFDYNRICPTDPCVEEDVCVRDSTDLATALCLETTTVCCADTCSTAPGCAGTTSSCTETTCAFYGTCPPLPIRDAAVAFLDGSVGRVDASLSDADTPADDGGPDRDAGPPRDAGSRPMDAGNGVMDAGPPPPPGFEPRFGGGGGCVCRAAPSRGGRSSAGWLPALGVAFALALRRRR
jgi:MYXO-CTERM domain-containing protein